MKSYRRPYRVYYELWREDDVEKYKKKTGIPLDITGYGRVMLRYRRNRIWNMTDYNTGLYITHIAVPKPEELYKCAEKFVLKVAISKIMDSLWVRDNIRDAREKARQIPLPRRYLDKEKYLVV